MKATARWPGDQVARVVVQNGLAGAAVAVGAYQSAIAEEVTRTRATWLGVAVAGLVLSGLANAAWLARSWQLVRSAQAAAVEEFSGLARLPETSGLRVPPPPPAGDGRVSGPGMTRYHRTGCPLVAARPVTSVSRAQARRRALTPCEVCEA